MASFSPKRWSYEFYTGVKTDISLRTKHYVRKGPGITTGLTMPGISSLNIGNAKKMTAAVMFFDLANFSLTTSDLAEEETLHIVNLILPTAMKMVRGWGGAIEKNTGDGIMAIFGTETRNPVSMAEYAIDAAMAIKFIMINDIQPNLAKVGLPYMRFRIGIDMGELLIARVGINNYSFLTAVGDAANRASKLQGYAELDGICVGDNVFHNLRPEYKRDCEKGNHSDWEFTVPGTNLEYRFLHFPHELAEPVKPPANPKPITPTVPARPDPALESRHGLYDALLRSLEKK